MPGLRPDCLRRQSPHYLGYIDTEILNPSALVMGLGYAKCVSRQFSIGAQVKYAAQQFGDMLVQFEDDSLGVKKYTASTIAIDFGTLFDVGYKGIKFGMSIRNFSNEIIFENKATELPLTFTMGITTDILSWFDSMNSPNMGLKLNIDAVHPRSYPEHINTGLEFSLLNKLFVRYGYMQGKDIMDHNIGFGLNLNNIGFDYSYSTMTNFKDIQKFSINISI